LKKNAVFFALACVLFSVSIHGVNAQNYSYSAHQHLKRSMDYLINGDYHNAISSSDLALKLDPNLVISYIIRARAYYEIDELDRAIIDCSHAIKLDGSSTTAYTLRGNAYGKKGDYIMAISNWETALKIDHNNSEARTNLELLYQLLKEELLVTNAE